jgi:hypothetical protein
VPLTVILGGQSASASTAAVAREDLLKIKISTSDSGVDLCGGAVPPDLIPNDVNAPGVDARIRLDSPHIRTLNPVPLIEFD